MFLLSLAVLSSAAFADDEVQIGVLRFSSSTVDVGTEQATIMGDVVTQRLSMSDAFSVIGYGEIAALTEGQRFQSTGYVSTKNAIQIGKAAGCRYIVTGNVTQLKMKASSSGVAIIGAFGSHKEEATAAADINIVDVEAESVVASFSESSQATQSGSYGALGGFGGGESDLNGMLQAAISDLATKLCLRIRDTVGDPVTVTTASAKEVTLGIGSMGGANKGSLFRIITGTPGREQTIAVVKVNNATTERSTASLADKNSGNLSLVRKGDKIMPTDSSELKALQKGKKFVKSRPKESTGDSANIEELLKETSTKKTRRTTTKRAK